KERRRLIVKFSPPPTSCLVQEVFVKNLYGRIASMQNHKKTIFSILVIILFVSACSADQPVDAPTPTESVFLTLPVTDTPAAPTETPQPTNTPLPALERAKYTLNTTIDYDAHTV